MYFTYFRVGDLAAAEKTGKGKGKGSSTLTSRTSSLSRSFDKSVNRTRPKNTPFPQSGIPAVGFEGFEEKKLLQSFTTDGRRNRGMQLRVQQLRAMLTKKIKYSLRNRALAFLQVKTRKTS